MKYLQICIDTTPEGIEPLSDRLIAIGADDFIVEDEADFLTFLEENKKYWNYVDEELLKEKRCVSRIKLYLGDEKRGNELLGSLPGELDALRAARDDIDFGTLAVECTAADGCDWENAWKKHYKPFKVGSKLYVKPEWEELTDSEGRIVYISNPGLAFGSGIHETTRLCMAALEDSISGGERVLDLGCGSGILSITALLLGAGSALGVDIDDKAADVSQKNAGLNGVSQRCGFVCGDIIAEKDLILIPEGGFDIVCANIVADVIIAVSGELKRFLKPGGTVISSGIIDTRLPDVCGAFNAAGLMITGITADNGWRAVIAKNTNRL